MATEVSSWGRLLNNRRENADGDGGNSDNLITRDLLGNLSNGKNRDMAFDELKPLSSPKSPLPSAKIKKEEESSSSSCSSYSDSRLQDLNYPPQNFFLDEKSLDLKLQSSPSGANSAATAYQSVCTLDKVKFALERAEKLESSKKRAPWVPISASSPPKMFAAACPGCYSYVMALSENPRCPRCNGFVPAAGKKPRIDLNASF